MNLKLKRNLLPKSFIFLTSVSLIFILCRMKKEVPGVEDIEQTIIKLEQEALDQWSKGNPPGFAMHAAEDITYFDDIGAQSRLDGIKEYKDYLDALVGKVPPHQFKLVDPKVQAYGTFAILTFQYHSKIDTIAGPPWKATSVYRLKDDEWKMIHAHWSLVKK